MGAIDYFYDQQVRRYLLQIVRAFSGFQYQIAGRNGGDPELRVVPCRLATQNRQVGHILRNNSENSVMSVPLITVFIKEMNIARERTQAPGHVSTVHVNEREIVDGEYTGERGNSYTVERMMPHPLDMVVQVDVWTSNEHQKHQLFEQIFMMFNVGFSIQSSDNPLDWSALTDMRLEGVNWTSRSVPVGTNDEIDVLSFTFKLELWINPPAKVKQQRLIHQVVTNILDGDPTQRANTVDDDNFSSLDGMGLTSVITTPDNAQIRVMGNEITLLGGNGEETDHNGNIYEWKKLLDQYGEMTPASSQIRLRGDLDQKTEVDIVGYIQFDQSRPNVLFWQVDIDTLPSNTMKPIAAIIDPLVSHPGNLPDNLTDGLRYLILNDMGDSKAWGVTRQVNGNAPFALAGDIIEYHNGFWTVAFAASDSQDLHYLVNLKTGKQLKFQNGNWVMAVDGEYNAGFWRVKL